MSKKKGAWQRQYRYRKDRVPGYGSVNYTPVSEDAPLTPAGRRRWIWFLTLLIGAGLLVIIWAAYTPGNGF